MNVNIKRARLIEFDWPDYRGQPTTPRITAMRNARGDAFDFLAIDGVVVGDEYSDCIREDDIAVRGKNIVVFDQFPVTLADLIPEGCEAFRFKRRYNVELTATRGAGEQADVWTINGMHGLWRDLNKLSDDLGVCLDTVVPLELRVHPQYMEERR